MTTYRHTQKGWAILIPVLILLALAIALVNVPAASPPAISLVVAGLLAVVALLFATLTVSINGQWLECRFGVGLIWRRIRLSDVRRAEAVRNRWYYGWGIRLTPHGWLWNASGLDAVELTFISGKRFRIGTDEPQKLLEAIRVSAMHAGSPK